MQKNAIDIITKIALFSVGKREKSWLFPIDNFVLFWYQAVLWNLAMACNPRLDWICKSGLRSWVHTRCAGFRKWQNNHSSGYKVCHRALPIGDIYIPLSSFIWMFWFNAAKIDTPSVSVRPVFVGICITTEDKIHGYEWNRSEGNHKINKYFHSHGKCWYF